MSSMTEKSQDKNETTNSESTKENKPELSFTGKPKIGDAQLPKLPTPRPKQHKDWVHSTPKYSITIGGNAVDPPPYQRFNVFTAGSIEMGKAVKWQSLMAQLLSDLPITVCDPRRPGKDWNPAMARVPDHNKLTGMRAQIDWELDAQDQADVICFFFDVDTNSPVSLLELGLFAKSKKVVVCCDDRYHKWDNVQITCERYGIPHVDTFAKLELEVRNMLKKQGMVLDGNGDLIGPNVHKPKPKSHQNSEAQLEADKIALQKQVDELKAMLATQSKM